MTTITNDLPAEQVATWRMLATRILSGLLAIAFGLLFFSLPLLVLTWFSTGNDIMHRVHGIGWGVTGGLLVAVSFASQAIRPRAYAGMQAALVAMFVVTLTSAIVAPETLAQIVPLLVVAVIVAAVHPQRPRLGDLAPRSRALLAILAIAAIPLVIYAVGQLGTAMSAAPADPHVAEENHYESMAAMALGLLAVGYVATAKRPGWRVPLYTAGIGAMLFGLASVLFGETGSVGPLWGALALLGGAAFMVVGEREARTSA